MNGLRTLKKFITGCMALFVFVVVWFGVNGQADQGLSRVCAWVFVTCVLILAICFMWLPEGTSKNTEE